MKRIILGVVLVGLLVAGIGGYMAYDRLIGRNNIASDQPFEFYIPTGSTYTDVLTMLEDSVVKDIESFEWLADRMNLSSHIYPGRYIIQPPMNNRKLITLLRSGKQVPVKLVMNKFRRKADIAGYVSKILEVDSAELDGLLHDTLYLADLNRTPDNITTWFIPNTYELYWDTDAREFMSRMQREYNNFWTESRKAQAKAQGLTPDGAIILASIVEEESQQQTERPTIAGLYLNRLHKGMKLEADPTVKFALQRFEIRRVLKADLLVQSPYNTYMNVGLPPGPICTPSINSINAVLNAEKHDYIFMCAKVDAPGYHAFAKTHSQHIENARKFQKWLNQQQIYR